jgi:hypothetical protein
MEEGRNAFNILRLKPTGKRPLGRPRPRWEDNIRMDLVEVAINTRNWVFLLRAGIIEGRFECGIKPPGCTSPESISIVGFVECIMIDCMLFYK